METKLDLLVNEWIKVSEKSVETIIHGKNYSEIQENYKAVSEKFNEITGYIESVTPKQTSFETLREHIEKINDERRTWVSEDPENRFTFLYIDDIEYWKHLGIETVEQFKKSNLITSIYDSYKDKHGIHPRGIKFNEMTLDELVDFEKNI